jgi:hypothetical protein
MRPSLRSGRRSRRVVIVVAPLLEFFVPGIADALCQIVVQKYIEFMIIQG